MLLMVVRLRSLLMNYMKNLSIRSFLFVKRSVHHLFRPPLIQPIPDSLQAKTITILHDLPGLHPLMGLLWVTPQPTRTVVLLLDHSSVVATGVILRDMWSQNVQFFANSNQNLQPPPRSGNQWQPRLSTPWKPRGRVATADSFTTPNLLIDSGASQHVTSDLNNLSFHTPYDSTYDIVIGNGRVFLFLISVLHIYLLILNHFNYLMFFVYRQWKKILFIFHNFIVLTKLLLNSHPLIFCKGFTYGGNPFAG